jgi:hypothetical protein
VVRAEVEYHVIILAALGRLNNIARRRYVQVRLAVASGQRGHKLLSLCVLRILKPSFEYYE